MSGRLAKEIFLEALGRNGRAREQYLDLACGADETLAVTVRDLLRAHEEAAGFLDRTEADPDRSAGDDAHETVPHEGLGDRLGPYRIEERIGEGGFGDVYLALQDEPVRRRVALKIIKPGMDTRQVIRRFEHERQALAVMDHPGIARVFDAGTTQAGRPYFVMEFVDGPPITEYCDAARLSVADRLRLVERVCRAVQHAHQKGVIHRDIKPSNVLVTTVDGLPEPRVIDFGIAKAIEPEGGAATVTQAHQVVGTPLYMSPEQASPDHSQVDTRTDVYSLGILLYELLTGVTPLESERVRSLGPTELERVIAVEEAPRPSARVTGLGDGSTQVASRRRVDPARLARELRGDLDWIIMRAIAKEPARRYATANALAEDIERFLRHEPVAAGPPSSTYRLTKFARRHRAQIAVVSAIALALVVLGAGGILFALRERAASARIAQELARAQAFSSFARSIFIAVDPREAQGEDTVLLRRILADATERVDVELDAPEDAAEMWTTIGEAYHRIGHYEDAESSFKKAEQRILSAFDPDHPLAEEARFNQAVILAEQTKYDESAIMFEAILASREARLGPDDPAVDRVRHDLGAAYRGAGRFAEARDIFEPMVEERRARLGPAHGDTLSAMNTLALVYGSLDDPERAAALLEEVARQQEASLGEAHPHTLATLNNLAGTYQDLERPADAIATFERVLEVKRTLYEGDHPSLCTTLVNLSSVYVDEGRYEEAETALREALEIADTTLPPEHMYRLGVRNALGRCLTKSGRPEEAEPVLAPAVEMIQSTLGPDHPNAIVMSGNLAALRLELERYALAEVGAREAVERGTSVLGPAHTSTLGNRKTHAQALAGLGRAEEAEALLRQAYADAVEAHGADASITTGLAEAMQEFLSAEGRDEEADAWGARE